MVANNESAIISRLVPANRSLTARAAEGLLAITFEQSDLDRMNALAASARDGSLTAEQQAELESYNRVGHLLAMIHSRARLALQGNGGLRRE